MVVCKEKTKLRVCTRLRERESIDRDKRAHEMRQEKCDKISMTKTILPNMHMNLTPSCDYTNVTLSESTKEIEKRREIN